VFKESNIASQQAFGEAVNSGNLDALDLLVTPDSVDRGPAPGQGVGPAGYEAMFGEMRTAFPDLKIEVEHLTAAEADVAFAYTVSGTHRGEFQGHAATGGVFSLRGVQISRFVDDKLAERWGSSDQLGMLSQLGLA